MRSSKTTYSTNFIFLFSRKIWLRCCSVADPKRNGWWRTWEITYHQRTSVRHYSTFCPLSNHWLLQPVCWEKFPFSSVIQRRALFSFSERTPCRYITRRHPLGKSLPNCHLVRSVNIKCHMTQQVSNSGRNWQQAKRHHSLLSLAVQEPELSMALVSVK